MNRESITLPSAVQPLPPRYTGRPFPPYRFVPGRAPHPRRHPDGHLYGAPDIEVAAFDPAQWVFSEVYLYGVDLYNHAYWWESHEQWEALWKASADPQVARFLQGLVQVAAANLRRFMGSHDSGAKLAAKACERLAIDEDYFLGIDVAHFQEQITQYFAGTRPDYPLIGLRFPACDIG